MTPDAVGLPPRSGARCERCRSQTRCKSSRTRTPSESAIGAVGTFICEIAKEQFHAHHRRRSAPEGVIEDRLREKSSRSGRRPLD